jgi:hypothetical protein
MTKPKPSPKMPRCRMAVDSTYRKLTEERQNLSEASPPAFSDEPGPMSVSSHSKTFLQEMRCHTASLERSSGEPGAHNESSKLSRLSGI